MKNTKTILKFEDIDCSDMVNLEKAKRAFKGVYGGAKGDTAEICLANKLRGEFEGEELVREVYKGLGGLIDKPKAKINRVNKEKAKKNKERK